MKCLLSAHVLSSQLCVSAVLLYFLTLIRVPRKYIMFAVFAVRAPGVAKLVVVVWWSQGALLELMSDENSRVLLDPVRALLYCTRADVILSVLDRAITQRS